VGYPDSKRTAWFELALVVAMFAGWSVLGSVKAVLAAFPDREAYPVMVAHRVVDFVALV
jgi:hypothetical protein